MSAVKLPKIVRPAPKPAPDPRITARLRAEFIRRFSPEWMQRAACAGQPVATFFTDEVADTEPLAFPETVYDALRVCSSCPVIRECISHAYDAEKPLTLLDPWQVTTDADDDRFGVWGAPGRVRERFAAEPERVQLCLDWTAKVALERRWIRPTATLGQETA